MSILSTSAFEFTSTLSSITSKIALSLPEEDDLFTFKHPTFESLTGSVPETGTKTPPPENKDGENNNTQAAALPQSEHSAPSISTMDIYEGQNAENPSIDSLEILNTEEVARPDISPDPAIDMGQTERPDISPDYTPSDSYFRSQWHINDSSQSANVMDVWDEYRGDGVKVAILDDGIDTRHVDLSENYNHSMSYDFTDNSTGAHISSWSKHGTAVGGVIAADDNGTGTVGAAPDSTLIGYKINYSDVSFNDLASGFGMARNNADVMNNSWSFNTSFADNKLNSGYRNFFDAIENTAQYGRDGLGTVIVNSAGNSRASGDDVNYHNFQNSPYTIAVGSINSNGAYSSSSTPGAAVLLSAPGRSIYTTDVSGSGGYSGGDYVSINGTSFSAPLVSGVVALMLEANPELGYRDVQEILAMSARNSHTSFSDWQTNGAENWNGGGMTFSHQYGHGAVDAHAAVRLAESWDKQSTFSNMETASYSNTSNVSIPDNKVVSSSINVSKDIEIDHVLVTVDIDHARVGHLQLTLVSPDGTESILLNKPGTTSSTGSGSSSSFTDFEFSTVAHWGESSQGTWTLQAYDNRTGTTGTLDDWSIKFIGDNQTAHDTYVYTNDYSKVNNSTTLSDNDGGTDTINAAAVTSSSIIDLSGQSTGRIDGKSFRVANGDNIENAITGDGDDTIYGNGAGNYIYGGRGDDDIYGSAGRDTLDGGDGSDTAIYSLGLSNFGVQIVSAAEMILSSAATSIDKLLNFEWFSFGGTAYSYDDMVEYANSGEAPENPEEPEEPENPPEEPEEPEEPEQPPEETDPAPSIYTSFNVTTESGSGATYKFDSNEYTETVISSEDMGIGSASNDEALVINRQEGELSMQGGDHIADSLNQLYINTDEAIAYDVSQFKMLRFYGQSIEDDMSLKATDVQYGVVYTGDGNDNISVAVEYRDGSTSSTANALTIRSADGDDEIVVTGDNPYFRSNIDLGEGNNSYKSTVDGRETIRGGNNSDVIETAGGDDRIYSGSGDDTLRSSGGDNYMYAGSGDDTLYGGSGNDYMRGDYGNDTLHTSGGENRLLGGGDADTFVIENVAGTNRIEDFNTGQGDTLDFSKVLTNYDASADNINDFLRVEYNSSTRMTELSFNVSGAGSNFVKMAELRGEHSLEDILDYAELGNVEVPPEEPEEPENPEEPGDPGEPPETVEAVDFSFRLINESGSLTAFRTTSETLEKTVLSSADLGIGSATNDEALVIDRTTEKLSVTTGDHVAEQFQELYITTTEDIAHDINGIAKVRVNGLNADNGLDMTVNDLQTGLIYGSDADDSLTLDARNIDGSTSSYANYLRLYTKDGDDEVTVTGDNPYARSLIDLGEGNNSYTSSLAGPETIRSGNGDDVIETGDGDDRIYAGGGDDIVKTSGGDNYLYGYGGNDTLYGGSGDDYIRGDDGNDTLYATGGNNRLYGGNGDDILYGGSGNDYIDAGSGNDIIHTSAGDNTLQGGAGADTFVLNDVDGRNEIYDFNTTYGDKLDISNVLSGYDEATDTLSDYLIMEYNSSERATEVKVKGADGFETRAELRGDYSSADVNQLLDDGHIIVTDSIV